MKRNGYRIFVEILLLLLCSWLAYAGNSGNQEQISNKHQLMTARDILTNSFSNVTIQNKTGKAVTVYGLYINQFADNTTVPNDCTAPILLYQADFNGPLAGGAFVSRVTLSNNQKLQIGKNYLYDMIYSFIYLGKQQGAVLPCALPGCGWFTTNPDNPDVKGTQWCIYLGILAPNPGNGAAKVPPYGVATSNVAADYDYNLVTNYGYIGPISCNDTTLNCSVSRAQNVAFPK